MTWLARRIDPDLAVKTKLALLEAAGVLERRGSSYRIEASLRAGRLRAGGFEIDLARGRPIIFSSSLTNVNGHLKYLSEINALFS